MNGDIQITDLVISKLLRQNIAEAVLSVFGFSRSQFGFDRKKAYHWWNEIYQQREKDIESAKSEL
jgi:hypothetical protein